MAKTYEALMKAQREQVARKKEAIAPESLLEPQATEPKEKAPEEKPPEEKTKEAVERPSVHHERIVTRVSVGSFIAKPDSVFAEQFRKLKSVITVHNVASSLRSILVTSCMAGEGKTTVALNLSASVAQGLDDSVILIEGDLRRRNLTSLFELQNTPGLSDVLEGRATIEEVIIATEINGLIVVPAGSNAWNPAELAGSVRMKTFIRQLGEKYRNSYIIIDSPPIISASEANVLSQIVDGIIVVILADKTRRDMVKRELRTINSEKILGVVLNCAEFEISDYYHKYQTSTGKKRD
jgi:capsular exopolysaccharide synthesis family protein